MINEDYMSKIQKPLMSFDIRVQILDNSLIGKEIDFDRLTPAKKLLLKEGAQVMFIKNDEQGNQLVNGKREVRWVNGTTGVVEGFSDDGETVFVRVKETVYPVGRSVWDDIQHEVVETVLPNGAIDAAIRPKTRIQYSQFPLKLAWALTIHKSQGQTYDAMYFDPSRIFAEGQTYVALSRSRSLEGIGLINPVTDNGVKVSEAVKQFMNTVKIKHLIEQEGSSSN
jgi:ATP-dependent exoDNAse (exonuclease V) alpha subunit